MLQSIESKHVMEAQNAMEFIYNFENLDDKLEVLVEKGREMLAYIS